MESSLNKICGIVKEFNERKDISMYDIVKERLNSVILSSISNDRIIECLSNNPEYVNDWISYSEDKRSSTGWYIKRNLNKWSIGYLNNATIENVKVFESKDEACAEFIINEINNILQ